MSATLPSAPPASKAKGGAAPASDPPPPYSSPAVASLYASGYTSPPPAPPSQSGRRSGEAQGGLEDFTRGVAVASSHLRVRMAFVRKVLAIVCGQLLLTAAVCAAFMLTPSAADWVRAHPGVIMFAQIGSLVTLLPLMALRKQVPANFILLGLFTVAMSFLVGCVTAMYTAASVMQAVLLTTIIAAGLALFTLQTKHDFTPANSSLVAFLSLMVGVSLIMMFFPVTETLAVGYSMLGALLFSAFLVVDLQLVMKKLSPDEYVLGAINLYLDLLNLLLHILRILGERR